MSTKISALFGSFFSALFPERDKEKRVARFSDQDILSLPRPTEEIPNIHSLFSYKDKNVQALIWELKYHRNPKALSLVGKMLAESICAELSDKMLFENWTNAVLVPVPMSEKRLRERTFSQTDLLCKEIMKYLPPDMERQIHYSPAALQKIRHTEKQSQTKNRAERLKNLRDVFVADDKIVAGKNIILIDDVATTGATIHEALRALKTAHTKHIIAFTVAH